MIVTTVIGKSFHNCITIAKYLGKYIALMLASGFVMVVLGGIFNILENITGIHITISKRWLENIIIFILWWISALITYDIFLKLGIFHGSDYEYTAARTGQEVKTKYDGLTSGANVVSWILSLVEIALAVILVEYFYRYDDYIGRLTLLAAQLISHKTGIGIALTFVTLVLYGGAIICALSCLSLLLPVAKYIRRRGLDVFSLPGILSIILYTWDVMNSRTNYILKYIEKDISWQYENIMGYMHYWADYDGTSSAYVLEHEYLLPILITVVFNAIAYYVLNRSVKSFNYNLYNVVTDNRHLIEDTVDPTDDYFKEQVRNVITKHDDIFATLVWTAYGVPMTGWELKQQYTKLGNVLSDYAPQKIAMYSDDDIQRIKNSGTIIHSENRIRSVISNAQVYCKILCEYGSFSNYFQHIIKDDEQTTKSYLRLGNTSLYGKLLAADLHYRGFKYIGPAKASEFLKNNYRLLIK